VPECCGLVWNESCVHSKRRPDAMSPSIGMTAFGSRWVSNFLGRSPSMVMSSAPQHPPAPWHRQPISAIIAASERCMTPFAVGAMPITISWAGQIGKSMAIGNPSGMPIRRRFVRTFTTSLLVEKRGRERRGAALRVRYSDFYCRTPRSDLPPEIDGNPSPQARLKAGASSVRFDLDGKWNGLPHVALGELI
jgi:hypothetical protein